jgi:hypothetical protein
MTGKASSRKLYVRSSGARSAVAKQTPLESRQLFLSPRDPFDQAVDLLVGDRRPLERWAARKVATTTAATADATCTTFD